MENEIKTTGFIFGGEIRDSPSTYSVHGLICASVDRFPVWNIKENHSEIILVGEGTQVAGTGFALATFTSPLEWRDFPPNPIIGAGLDVKIPTYDESTVGALSYRANNNALVAFLDGHVGAIPRGEVRLKNIVINP